MKQNFLYLIMYASKEESNKFGKDIYFYAFFNKESKRLVFSQKKDALLEKSISPVYPFSNTTATDFIRIIYKI